MNSNKAKCKVLHLGEGNPKLNYGPGRELIKENDFRVFINTQLNVTHQ